MFKKDVEYTRDEIHDEVGGSKQQYLPTKGGEVVAACLTVNFNPRAPEVILCGKSKIVASSGDALARHQGAIPVFIKRAVNRWLYVGDFKVKESYRSGTQFKDLLEGSGRSELDVSMAVVMERIPESD